MTQRESVSMEDILFGVGHGRSQSVGNMEVIPLIDEAGIQDEGFDPPSDVEVGTSSYGTVELRHPGSNPTIVPTGAGWVVKQAAQDHAIGSGTFIDGGERKSIDTAMCIQSNQSGSISKAAHEMLILPVGLRSAALALRHKKSFDKLWGDIGMFNSGYGHGSQQELAYFLKNFGKQLDQFVAEFELVPKQIGAVILINGKLVGVEMAPTVAFWSSIWNALIRVCYGSFAIRYADQAQPNRVPLQMENNSLDGIRAALEVSCRGQREQTDRLISSVRGDKFVLGTVDGQMRGYRLLTVGSPGATPMAGQMVLSEDAKTAPYLSVCVNSK